MRSASRRHRQRLLAEAFEQGIRHFDVARMYGLGAAERELGRFARGRREDITIATKFGIEPAAVAGQLARLQAPARAVTARFPALRATFKRNSGVFHQPHRYDLETLNASLEMSLRELDTDYVDVLFIHGPARGDILDMVELGAALDELYHAGRLRAWGIAGDPEPCIGLLGQASAPTILQLRDDILAGAPPRVPQGQKVITFGILSGALARIHGHITSSAERRARWTEMTNMDCGRSEVVASLLLQDALERNSRGTVLFGTTRPERVKLAMDALDVVSRELEPAPLGVFRELVVSELTPLVRVGG
jgi:D-threo-aldose 1-dehydrogenase